MSLRCSLFKDFLEKEGKAFLTKRSRAEDKGEKARLTPAKAFGAERSNNSLQYDKAACLSQ
jgi:hypothetical protein